MMAHEWLMKQTTASHDETPHEYSNFLSSHIPFISYLTCLCVVKSLLKGNSLSCLYILERKSNRILSFFVRRLTLNYPPSLFLWSYEYVVCCHVESL